MDAVISAEMRKGWKELIRTGLQHPELIADFARFRLRGGHSILRRHSVGLLLDRVWHEVTGKSLYANLLMARNGQFVEHEVLGHKLLIDLADRGISYDLLIHGCREVCAAQAFREELRKLCGQTTHPVVVDIGANLGYYTLQEAAIIGDRGRVIAYEPLSDVAQLLQYNCLLNSYQDVVEVVECALGDRNGRAEFLRSDASNCSQMAEFGQQVGNWTPNKACIDVDVRRLDDDLNDRGVPLDSVNVIRFDIEGYEVHALKGARETLRRSKPLILFFEVHPQWLRQAGQMSQLVDLLSENEFEIVTAIRHGRRFDSLTVDDIPDLVVPTNLLLKTRDRTSTT